MVDHSIKPFHVNLYAYWIYVMYIFDHHELCFLGEPELFHDVRKIERLSASLVKEHSLLHHHQYAANG